MKFTRTANLRDLKEGAVLLYGDQEIHVGQPMGYAGIFSVMTSGGTLGEIHPSVIGKFQIEIPPLVLVE